MSKRNHKRNQRLQPSNQVSLPPSKNDVDIVIPVYGKFDLLTQCLRAIPNAVENFTYRILIFDNNSPDNPDLFYKDLKDGGFIDPSLVSIFQSKENLGFAAACNRAAMRGNAEYIFHLNSDCIMHPGSIAFLLRTIKSDSNAGVVAPMLIFPSQVELIKAGMSDDKILLSRPEGKVQHVGLDTNIRGDFIHTLLGWSTNNPKVMKVDSAYAATGAALMIRRFLWNKIGGFWEGYGLGTYEDVDLCLTVRALGYNIRIVPSAVGTHYTNASTLTYNQSFPLHENRVKFNQRWGNKLTYTEWERW